MMLNRIQPETEKVLRPYQNSFRGNRSTVGQILAVQVIIEGVRIKAMIWSPNGDTDFFDVLASVFQDDKLTSFLFILSHYYVRRASVDPLNEIGFILEKA